LLGDAEPRRHLQRLKKPMLWKSGASFYTPEDYRHYKNALKEAEFKLKRERVKFGWFRNYKFVQAELRILLEEGIEVLRRVEEQKAARIKTFSGQLSELRKRIEILRRATLSINESQPARKSLAQAEVKVEEAMLWIEKDKFEIAAENIARARAHIQQAEETILAILNRYTDEKELEKWRKWAEGTVSESKKKGTVAILVNKLERKLTLYKRGEPIASYEIGLGRYGLSDKLSAGDDATPEGKYQIIKKIAKSRYYKAILINYPNAEDRKNFSLAKKQGLLPLEAVIGGLIEIHGGGKESLTDGCIAVEDEVMDVLFRLVEVGTPVTIVGALSLEKTILTDIKK